MPDTTSNGFPEPDEIESIEDFRTAYEELVDHIAPVAGNFSAVHGRLGQIQEQLDEFDDRLSALEEKVDVMDVTMSGGKRGKFEKVRDILRHAEENCSRGYTGGTKITTGEARGVAGCSADTARRLMEEIGVTFPWADINKPGGPNANELKLEMGEHSVEEMIEDVKGQFGAAEG